MCLSDRRLSLLGQVEGYRKKGQTENFIRHGSLERQKAWSDKRSSWNSEEIAVAMQTFKPVTLTVNSFFRQVREHLACAATYDLLLFVHYTRYTCNFKCIL